VSRRARSAPSWLCSVRIGARDLSIGGLGPVGGGFRRGGSQRAGHSRHQHHSWDVDPAGQVLIGALDRRRQLYQRTRASWSRFRPGYVDTHRLWLSASAAGPGQRVEHEAVGAFASQPLGRRVEPTRQPKVGALWNARLHGVTIERAPSASRENVAARPPRGNPRDATSARRGMDPSGACPGGAARRVSRPGCADATAVGRGRGCGTCELLLMA
jgi:hypothetical protein